MAALACKILSSDSFCYAFLHLLLVLLVEVVYPLTSPKDLKLASRAELWKGVLVGAVDFRRLSKDYENLPSLSKIWIVMAMVRFVLIFAHLALPDIVSTFIKPPHKNATKFTTPTLSHKIKYLSHFLIFLSDEMYLMRLILQRVSTTSSKRKFLCLH